MTLLIGCDVYIKYTGARDAVTGAYLNSGTCTYSLENLDGTVIAGGTGSLSYTSASDGDYLGVIDAAVTALLTEDEKYKVVITFSSSGYDDVQYVESVAKKRRR